MADRTKTENLQEPTANATTPPEQGRVFISYASPDAAVANALVESLERHGIGCWIAPRDVKAGALYADAIVRAIGAARAFVLVLSASAIGSSHVGKEVERASSKKRPIIALRTDNAPLTPALEYFLSESQWVEVQAGNTETAFARLTDAIREPAQELLRVSPGMAPSAGTTPEPLPKGRRNRILLVAVLGVVVVAVAALLADRFRAEKHGAADQALTSATSAVSDKSIAILPFTDMSEKHDQEYFSDGMTEEIIDLLVKVPELKVPARTSSFYFKGKSTQIPEIARQLGVANVLEGSVRKSGSHLRVTAQLVRADNGFHIWSETYDRQLDDVFKTQDEIAGAVVRALKVSLVRPDAALAIPTTNNEAYELYLQARELVNRESEDDILRGYEDLRQAVRLDPKFALAWASLAELLAHDNVNWGRVIRHAGSQAPSDSTDIRNWESTWAQTRADARAAAGQAIRLAPELAESHAARAQVLELLDWNWAAAAAETHRALEIEPNNAQLNELAADVPLALGNITESLRFAQRAAALDPLGHAWKSVGFALEFNGALQEAAQAFHRGIELYPTGVMAHFRYAQVLLELGEPQSALAEFEQETLVPARVIGTAQAIDALGRHQEAERSVALAEQKWGDAMAYQFAYFYAGRKDADRAFAWLDRAYRQHDGGMFYIKIDTRLRNLRQDPRFAALLRRMNLPE
jgi:TolB-like protein